MGPMAMCYNLNEGWVTFKLGPTSGHWIRKAKDFKPNKPKGEISPKRQKRGSSIPLHELDTNTPDLKWRKNKK